MVIFPLTLSLVFTGGLLLLGALLLLSASRRGLSRDAVPSDLPVEAGRYGPAQTNRWLRLIRTGFLLLCVAALGFHGFWVFGAPGGTEFNRASARDQRNRREAEAGLRGWVFDRTGKADRALVRYRLDGRRIVRDYPLHDAATNITGYSDFVYGSAGFERGYSDVLSEPSSAVNQLASPAPVGSDVVSTIDLDLQREAFALLNGRRGAAVVLSVPNSEVLAMASSPSFDPALVNDDDAWKALNEAAAKAPEQSPMTDRALKTYYLPGSTFKVLVTIAAIESGLADQKFTCTAGGFFAPGSRREILDDSRGAHGTIGLADALRVSCNEYFAQMGLKIGQARLAEVAARFGIKTGPPGALRDNDIWRFKVADPADFSAAFAPPPARVFLPGSFGDDYTPYSLAIESFGQGPNQMTIFQLALIAEAIAADGQLTKPAIEAGVDPAPIGRVCTPETAARVRAMMRSVVENGTAASAFGRLKSRVTAAGKTGTAQRDYVVVNPQTLEPETWRDRDGHEHVKRATATDALFVGFAPYDHPQIAFAMILEDAGHGGTAAAPIAVGLIDKAVALGLVTASAPATATRPNAGPRQPRARRR